MAGPIVLCHALWQSATDKMSIVRLTSLGVGTKFFAATL